MLTMITSTVGKSMICQLPATFGLECVWHSFFDCLPIQEATAVWIDISIVPVPCTCTTDFIKFDPCMEKTVSNETTNGYTVSDTHKTKDHENKNKKR